MTCLISLILLGFTPEHAEASWFTKTVRNIVGDDIVDLITGQTSTTTNSDGTIITTTIPSNNNNMDVGCTNNNENINNNNDGTYEYNYDYDCDSLPSFSTNTAPSDTNSFSDPSYPNDSSGTNTITLTHSDNYKNTVDNVVISDYESIVT